MSTAIEKAEARVQELEAELATEKARMEGFAWALKKYAEQCGDMNEKMEAEKAKVGEALKALDNYWLCYHIVEGLDADCPICEDGEGTDCLEIAWDRWKKALCEIQGAK